MITKTKAPEDVLDYVWAWSEWLDGDTISQAAVTPPDGITVSSQENDATSVTAWIEGGRQGGNYDVVCQITTAAGRRSQWTLRVEVRAQ